MVATSTQALAVLLKLNPGRHWHCEFMMTALVAHER